MGVHDAAELWGLSADHVKLLAKRGDIEARKIGKTWIIDKNQHNPRQYQTINSRPKRFDKSKLEK